MSGRAKKAPPREFTLEERRQPGLSRTLTGPRAPTRCQACSARHEETNPLGRWIEHDEWDKPLPIVVVLCRRCSGQLIEPHPRLYRALTNGEPYPGAMSICVRCPARRGLTCTSPAFSRNRSDGGTLRYEFSEPPYSAHLNMGRSGASGFYWFFPGRVIDCSGRPMIPPEPRTPSDAVRESEANPERPGSPVHLQPLREASVGTVGVSDEQRHLLLDDVQGAPRGI